MVGYGAEDDHFVVELTYNYGIKNYKLGNDFLVRIHLDNLGFFLFELYYSATKLYCVYINS